eukprot:scaffold18435_cov113-Isochrysis_galbana.AAC.1
MPEPHVTPSRPWPCVGTPEAWKTCSSASGASSGPPKPPCNTSVKGTFRDPGMWPERRPGRGSGASPLKRGAARASTMHNCDPTAETDSAPGVPAGQLVFTASKSSTSPG